MIHMAFFALTEKQCPDDSVDSGRFFLARSQVQYSQVNTCMAKLDFLWNLLSLAIVWPSYWERHFAFLMVPGRPNQA